ncbi:MAG: hypothetical protein LIR46_06090 [Bacteroidota bacterium]|nr:hypothetical protein [Bacteroidota bacterium]
MQNEYYGIASTPTEDFLAHYGIRGMKWGVRKSIERGNDVALGRHYQKARKKLAKLEKQAAKVSKYKKRAIGMGIGAAAAGGLAAAGTKGVGAATRGAGAVMAKGSQTVGSALANIRGNSKAAAALRNAGATIFKKGSSAGIAMQGAGRDIERWGKGNSMSKNIGKTVIDATGSTRNTVASTIRNNASKLHNSGVSNNTLARIGAGAVGVGLAAGAARNAYKARTAEKKAKQFRAEMNKAFAGTKYANGAPASKKSRKRRGSRA